MAMSYTASPERQLSSILSSSPVTGSTQTLDAYMVTASTALSQIMGLEAGAPLVYMRRLFLANAKPIAISTTHLAHNLCPGILER